MFYPYHPLIYLITLTLTNPNQSLNPKTLTLSVITYNRHVYNGRRLKTKNDKEREGGGGLTSLLVEAMMIMLVVVNC